MLSFLIILHSSGVISSKLIVLAVSEIAGEPYGDPGEPGRLARLAAVIVYSVGG